MTHWTRQSVDPTRTCIDCDGPVSPQSKTGRCRRCSTLSLNRNAAVRAKAGQTLSRTYATNPEIRERHAEGCRRGAAARMADPAQRERARELGRQVGSLAYSTRRTPEQRARDIEAQTRAQLPWCPPEYRDLYRQLKAKGYRAAERRQIILDAIPGTDAHARRQVANHAISQRIRAERDREQSY